MSSQQQKEKVRITINESSVTESEVKDLVSVNEKLWRPSGDNKDFENTVYEEFKKIAPSFCILLDNELNKPENKDKAVSFMFKDYQFGVRNSNGYEFLWRRKTGNSGGGGGSYGNKPAMPLAEMFFGTIDECNAKIKDESKKWYLADQQIIVSPEDGRTVMGFGILKRNRFIPS